MISVRFIKKEDFDNAAAKDDAVTITCTGLDQFSLSYSRNCASVTLSGDNVFRWFRRQLRMLEARDLCPYGGIQLDIPGFQYHLFYVNDIDREYDTILDALDFALDHWPGMQVKEPTCRRHYVWLD